MISDTQTVVWLVGWAALGLELGCARICGLDRGWVSCAGSAVAYGWSGLGAVLGAGLGARLCCAELFWKLCWTGLGCGLSGSSVGLGSLCWDGLGRAALAYGLGSGLGWARLDAGSAGLCWARSGLGWVELGSEVGWAGLGCGMG